MTSTQAAIHGALTRWFSELTHEGLFATDTALRVVVWSRWMEIHTRRPASEVLGRPLLELYPDLASRGIDRRYFEAVTDGRVSTLSHGLHGYVLSLPQTHGDLGLLEMPQSGRIAPLMDGDVIVGTVTVIENVSERLSSESELRKQIDAQKVARAAAENALREKDEFLSTLSHELRTPLNAVLGWARILLARKENKPEVITRALEVIERNAAAQAAMIDDILDVARVVAGKLRLDMLPTDLTPVVMAAVDVVTPSATAKRINVSTSIDRATPQVLADPGRLQQILWNLLSNAVKFSGPGGTIDITLGRHESGARLVVKDTGQGIAPEFLPYVFDRFRQSDASSARRQGGLGLGLALARDLVHLHGGTIRAESAGLQRGASFVIDLPALSPAVAMSRSDIADRDDVDMPSLSGVLALVVDDEADSRELLVAALARYGADVVSASSCDEALARLASVGETPIDVLVSDIGMPQLDGYELMRRVRALEHDGRRIPAVAVTGYATESDRERVLAAGYNTHVAKPIRPVTVATAVRRALQEKSSF
jgi:signal transduction histidine kinase/CheY-like chemotaxis protein